MRRESRANNRIVESQNKRLRFTRRSSRSRIFSARIRKSENEFTKSIPKSAFRLGMAEGRWNIRRRVSRAEETDWHFWPGHLDQQLSTRYAGSIDAALHLMMTFSMR